MSRALVECIDDGIGQATHDRRGTIRIGPLSTQLIFLCRMLARSTPIKTPLSPVKLIKRGGETRRYHAR